MKFGTDGIRGPAGAAPIDADGAFRVGAAAVRLAPNRVVIIGHDTRPSGPALVASVAEGVQAAGGIARLAGVVPTAAVAFALADGLAGAGVMVTASHNPAADNGFKVFDQQGRKLDEAGIARFESWLDAEAGEGRGQRDTCYPWASWRNRVLEPHSGLFGQRIAVDLANGALTGALRELKARTDWVFVGDGGEINAGCGSQYPAHLASTVVAAGCVAGIAVDGDADRCVLIDEQGQVVSGDALIWLLARGLAVTKLAVTVMSNAALEASLPGVEVHRTPVGDRHLREAMDDGQLSLGAEESGHVIFDDLPAGDGLLTGLTALACVSGPLSQAVAGFVPMPRRTAKLPVTARPPLDGLEPLVEVQQNGTASLDGGRVFLRYSGTEPVLRILVEGRDAGRVDAVLDDVVRVANEVLG